MIRAHSRLIGVDVVGQWQSGHQAIGQTQPTCRIASLPACHFVTGQRR
jgi:hypothetical protein